MSTSLKNIIAEEIYEALNEAKGEKSETNLTQSINDLVEQNNGKPVRIQMGVFGTLGVISADKPGGTPKTDVLVKTTSRKYPEIGISMKLPNADFIDNRRTNEQVYDMMELFSGGPTASRELTSAIRGQMSVLSGEWKNAAHEKAALREAVMATVIDLQLQNQYPELAEDRYQLKTNANGIDEASVLVGKYPQDIVDLIAQYLGELAGCKSGLQANIYSLSQMIPQPVRYAKIIQGLIGGKPQIPPEGANAYFLGEIGSPNSSAKDLSAAFNAPWRSTKALTTIPEAAEVLGEFYDPSFRLRAITPARAVLSKTNLSHYRKGETGEGKGLSWTTFFVKRRPGKELDDDVCNIKKK